VPRISVIICSNNPRPGYLHRVFEALQAQTLSREEWELVLVDNASTRRLADQWDLSWHPGHAHIRENELGLTRARLLGIKETTAALLLFLDDDNVLPPDYLDRAFTIEQQHPDLGAFGAAIIEPEFEIEPSPELRGLLHLLTLRHVPRPRWTNNSKDTGSVPWGAGLCVTRPTAEAYVQVIARLGITDLLGRRGQRLFSGDDDVFSWVAADIGRGFGIFPELRLTHLIAAERLNQKYFVRLVHDHALSHTLLDYLLSGEEPHPMGPLTAARILLHGLRRGPFSMRCQWAAARGVGRAARLLSRHGVDPIWKHQTEPV